MSDPLSRAHAAHDRRDWAEAAAQYERFVQTAEAPADALISLGDVRLEMHDPVAARRAFVAAIRARPDDVPATLRVAKLAAEAGDHVAARLALRAACVAQASSLPELPPLRDRISPATREALEALGWLRGAADIFARSSEDYGLGAAGALPVPPLMVSVGGSPVRADGVRARLVVIAAVDAGRGEGRAAARRVAMLAQEAEPGAALVVVLMMGPSTGRARAESDALGHELSALGSPAFVLQDEGRATSRCLCNLGLSFALTLGADALLVEADAPQGVEAVTAEVFAADPMAGFAVAAAPEPATPAAARGDGVARAEAPWRYGPARAGPVIRIRNRVLAELGGLDAAYDDGAAARLDLMMRANRLGFSCLTQGSERQPEPCPPSLDARLFARRYPEHALAEARHRTGPGAEAERLAAARDRGTLLLDLTGLRAHHDGTSELAVALSRALAAAAPDRLHLWGAADALRFHGLDAIVASQHIARAGPLLRPHAACLKVGQPFDEAELLRTWSAAPLAGFYMLDAISLDVARLDVADLRTLWADAFAHSEMIGYLSDYTRAQLLRRLPPRRRPGDFTALCSTAADEYSVEAASALRGSGALLVGNSHAHKNLAAATAGLRARWPDLPLTVLGRPSSTAAGVDWVDSGRLSEDEIARLYAQAELVVFPSLYEGFGLPVMHALAHRRPVLAIDQPVFREIAARCQLGRNLHLFSSTHALVEGVATVRAAGLQPADPLVRQHRWADAAREVLAAVDRARAAFDHHSLFRRTSLASRLQR